MSVCHQRRSEIFFVPVTMALHAWVMSVSLVRRGVFKVRPYY